MLPTAALLAVLLAPAKDQPEPSSAIALSWRAPSTCPQQGAVEARLQTLLPELGPVAPAGMPAPLQVVGSVELADAEHWIVTLTFEGERGRDKREFSGRDCVVLADAAALVIAVAVDPLGVSLTLAAEPEPELEPATESAPSVVPSSVESSSEPEPEPEPEPELTQFVPLRDGGKDAPALRFAFSLLGGGGYGPLRLAQASVGAELGLFGPRWRAGVRSVWLPPRSQRFLGGTEARFDGFAITARGCGVPGVKRVEFPICAGVEAGALRGQGTGTTPNPRDARLPWAAIVIGPSLRWAIIDRLALGLDVELLAPLVRGGFMIGNEVIERISPVGAQAFAAVELRLP